MSYEERRGGGGDRGGEQYGGVGGNHNEERGFGRGRGRRESIKLSLIISSRSRACPWNLWDCSLPASAVIASLLDGVSSKFQSHIPMSLAKHPP